MGGSKIECMSSSENPKVDPSDLLAATKRDLREARETVYELSAELGELRVQLNLAKNEVQSAHDRNRLVLNSFTWKLGLLLMTPRRVWLRILKIRRK
jgi:hypothetical protein